MSDLVEKARTKYEGNSFIQKLADRIEELEAARQKLTQERFKLSAEATAHLESFGIPWEDDGYTIVGLLISKCEKLIKERDELVAPMKTLLNRKRPDGCEGGRLILEVDCVRLEEALAKWEGR